MDSGDSQVASEAINAPPRNRPANRAGSLFTGVSQYKRTKRYEAHIWLNSSILASSSHKKSHHAYEHGSKKGKQLHLGSFGTAAEAASAYDRAALFIRGPGAELNFPEVDYSKDEVLQALKGRNLTIEAFVVAMREMLKARKGNRSDECAIKPTSPTDDEGPVAGLAAAAAAAAAKPKRRRRRRAQSGRDSVSEVSSAAVSDGGEGSEGEGGEEAAREGRDREEVLMPVPSAAAAATPSDSMDMSLGCLGGAGLEAEPLAISSGPRRALALAGTRGARLGSPGSPGSPLSPRTPGAVSHRMPQPFPSLTQGQPGQGPFAFGLDASSYLIPTFNHSGVAGAGPGLETLPASGPGAFCYPEAIPHAHGQGLMIPGGGDGRVHGHDAIADQGLGAGFGFGSFLEGHGLAGPGAAGCGAMATRLQPDDSDLDDPHLPGLRPLSSPPPAPSGTGPSKWAQGTTEEDLALWALFSTPTAGQLGPWEDLEPSNGAKGAGGRGNGFNAGGAAPDRGASSSLTAQFETIFRAQSDPEPAAGSNNDAPGFGYGGLSDAIDLAERLAVGGPADPSMGWPSAAADREDLHIPTSPSTPH